jgi:hypothetical protein
VEEQEEILEFSANTSSMAPTVATLNPLTHLIPLQCFLNNITLEVPLTVSPISAFSINTVLRSIHSPIKFSEDESMSIIWDTGASRSVTFDAADFEVGSSRIIPNCALRGLAKGLSVTAEGMVTWTVLADNGQPFHWRHIAYLVPESPVRLLSCQSFQQHTLSTLGHAYEFVLRVATPPGYLTTATQDGVVVCCWGRWQWRCLSAEGDGVGDGDGEQEAVWISRREHSQVTYCVYTRWCREVPGAGASTVQNTGGV